MEDESNNISDSRLMVGVLDEHNSQCTKGNTESSFKQLFQKVLTQSDVGNNMFVISRRYAIEYLSHIQHNEEMDFYDRSRKSWKFSFFYCQSSKIFIFIFTKGWHKFVKAKILIARDAIVFNLCESKNGTNENCNTFVIDVVKNVEGLPMDLALNHDVVDVDAALTPIFLFGKQIGWTKKKRGNEV
ncbi:hypothetical protein R3W88_031776 [Solanum pinnatisectum]|uniref:TF-B3 domain-containing protein n=1 Tax=Solanum pinnatisectum TaxID=50273 RepID=A0AAV9LQS3_9SOLN|nr:hypothetical protein R3W88_031776 [Solanum pinnatisectum]